MKIVEYAIKIRDMGSSAVVAMGRKVAEQSNKTREYAAKVEALNKCYSLSYAELGQKIQETENVIRNSVLKSEIRQARQELSALQRQVAMHPGNSGTVKGKSPVSGSGGGGGMGAGAGVGAGLALGGMLKGGLVVGAVMGAVSAMREFSAEAQQAYEIQNMAETKLGVIMRQRMGASDDQIDAVKKLASEQQKIGVIGDEVQLAGGQQLGTFLNKTESLKTLLPAMNNLLAQQKGVNATDQDAVGIGNLMGKVMQGQTSALRRVGVSFSEAEEKVLQYGNEQERAAMLAQVIKNNVGEMNKELAKTDAGKLKQDSNDDGDRAERFGEQILKMKVALLPLDNIIDDIMESFLPLITALIPVIEAGVQWVANAVNAAKPFFDNVAAGFADKLTIVKSLWTDHIWPAVSKVWSAVTRIVGGIIEWYSKSELIKDIWAGVAWIFGKMFDMVGDTMKGLEWMWDNVVQPILDAVEKVYKWIKGGGEVKVETNTNGELKIALPKSEKKEGKKILDEIKDTTTGNAGSAQKAEAAIQGGAQKTITINISKFFDNININAASITESTADIEAAVLQCMARIVNQGAVTLSQ